MAATAGGACTGRLRSADAARHALVVQQRGVARAVLPQHPVGTHGEAAPVAARVERQHSPAEPIRHRGAKRLQRGTGDAPHAQSSGQQGQREAEGPLDHRSNGAERREGVIAGQSSPEHL